MRRQDEDYGGGGGRAWGGAADPKEEKDGECVRFVGSLQTSFDLCSLL